MPFSPIKVFFNYLLKFDWINRIYGFFTLIKAGRCFFVAVQAVSLAQTTRPHWGQMKRYSLMVSGLLKPRSVSPWEKYAQFILEPAQQAA